MFPTIRGNIVKLNEVQLKRFTEIFEIKAKSVILIEKKNKITVVINSVIIFNVKKRNLKGIFKLSKSLIRFAFFDIMILKIFLRKRLI